MLGVAPHDFLDPHGSIVVVCQTRRRHAGVSVERWTLAGLTNVYSNPEPF